MADSIRNLPDLDELEYKSGGYLDPGSNIVDQVRDALHLGAPPGSIANDEALARALQAAETHPTHETPQAFVARTNAMAPAQFNLAHEHAMQEAARFHRERAVEQERRRTQAALADAARARADAAAARAAVAAPITHHHTTYTLPSTRTLLVPSYTYDTIPSVDRLYRWALGLFPTYNIYEDERKRVVRKAIYELIKKYARERMDEDEIEARVRKFLSRERDDDERPPARARPRRKSTKRRSASRKRTTRTKTSKKKR